MFSFSPHAAHSTMPSKGLGASGARRISERDKRGNEGIIMGDGIQINGVAKRFSSHTLSHSRPSRPGKFTDTNALRDRLIAAIVEVIGDGGDPRLIQSRAVA